MHFRMIREILSEDRRGKLILKDDKGPASTDLGQNLLGREN